MATNRPTEKMRQELRAKLLVPPFIEAREAGDVQKVQVTPLQELVDHVLADDHPGDDNYEPQWLIAYARNVFSPQKMRARLGAQETPIPLAEIARDCVNDYDDGIMSWGAIAFEGFGWQDGSRFSPLRVTTCAMIICLVALSPEPTEVPRALPERGA
jgi:hypothetical protein